MGLKEDKNWRNTERDAQCAEYEIYVEQMKSRDLSWVDFNDWLDI
ncbi:hypothetical protein [Photobacterium lutimaris]|nr:hypothetical protein [Photobacterium lutimaris]TDR76058.1 hypothetical protein DFP78_10347 [Photobacterium lutimaris]